MWTFERRTRAKSPTSGIAPRAAGAGDGEAPRVVPCSEAIKHRAELPDPANEYDDDHSRPGLKPVRGIQLGPKGYNERYARERNSQCDIVVRTAPSALNWVGQVD